MRNAVTSGCLGVAAEGGITSAFAAGPGDTAIGEGASVGADNSSAFGAGATVLAGHTNSTAIGAGATTTRADQVMVGTASTTYTMPGLTSSASRAAQGSPTHIVTSNAAGDLAAYTPSELGLATQTQVASLQSDVAGLQSDINRLGRRDQQLTEGIATVAALAQPMMLPGQHFAVRTGWGGFERRQCRRRFGGRAARQQSPAGRLWHARRRWRVSESAPTRARSPAVPA
jgi:hypothetical protein